MPDDAFVRALAERYLLKGRAVPQAAQSMLKEQTWPGLADILAKYTPGQPEWMQSAQRGYGSLLTNPDLQPAWLAAAFSSPSLKGGLTPAVKVLSEKAGAPGVYSAGPTHGDALSEWLEARRALRLPEIKDEHWDDLSDHVVDGYTTPEGKFLNRSEAAGYLGMAPTHELESGELPNRWEWE